jgi:hypothetical protein
MSTVSTTLGWARALTVGGALLVGAIMVAGPAAADDGAGLSNTCLEATNINLTELRESTTDSSHSFFEDTSATAGGSEIDAARATYNATNAIDQAESVGFTQVDAQSGAAQLSCNR